VPAEDRVESLVRLLGERFVEASMHMHHPLYLGHQVAVPVIQAALADLAVSFLNPSQAVYEISPGANAIEAVVVRWLAGLAGFGPGADGLVTSGGSVANLTALLAARNFAVGESAFREGVVGDRLAVIVSADHHYSIARAALILGVGREGVIAVPVDAKRRMDPARIQEAMALAQSRGRRPFVLCASAGSTPIGAFDPLVAVGDEARRLGLWFHVDAAHGGAGLLSTVYRDKLRGIEAADSVTWDPHKTLLMPGALGTVLVRDGQKLVGAFHQEAPYLFDAHHPELAQFDIAKKSIACTQRADCVKLWACLKVFGARTFGSLYDRCCATARRLYERIEESADFETIHEPESNILCFRHVAPNLRDNADALDRHNAALRAAVVRDGRAYLTPGRLDGRDVLRAVVMNPMTTERDLETFLGVLRELGAKSTVDHGPSTGGDET
jgi:L-2,4-diaminobutyrate decarboxylase